MAKPVDTAEDAQDARSSQPSVGERLRKAREKGDMSIADAAELLHLDHWMVEALETDDFAALGAPVFAKGHMRTYAALLGLNPDDLMIAYYEVQGTPETPPIVGRIMPSERPRTGVPWAPMGAGVFALAAIAALAWWFFVREVPVAQVTPAASEAQLSRQLSVPAVSTAEAGIGTGTVATRGGSPETDQPALQVQEPAAPEAAPESRPEAALPETSGAGPGSSELPPEEAAAQPAPVAFEPAPQAVQVRAGEVALRLRFSGESWVEVHAADGTRLLWGLRKGGAVEELRGDAPLEVFLGRAAEVALEVNGEPYVIPDGSRRRDTARFRINAP